MEAGGGSALRQGGGGGGGGGGEEGAQHTTTIRWKPNEECLELLLAMGIDRNAAIKGLYYTGNHSAEFAASYVFDNPDLDEELDGSMRIESESQRQQQQQQQQPQQQPQQGATRSTHVHDSDEEAGEVPHYKMVFVVNSSLYMSVGKTASQVAHASVALYRRLINDDKNFANQLLMWEEEGEKKVVLRGEDVSHLRQIEKQATSMDLATYLIQDAGRTEVPPDSVTVLGIFGREEMVSFITGKLPLL